MNIRIVLLPDKTGGETFEKYSELINEKFSCLFRLGKNCIPHVTLLHIEIEDKKVQEIREELENIAKETDKIFLIFKYARHGTESKAFIGLYFKDNDKVIHLRDKIHEQISGYISNTASYKIPHLTLTRLKNEEDVDSVVLQLANFPKNSIVFSQIAICESGRNGTCVGISESYSLN
ncbi:MAG: 2'-5' RNA ligase family protein [Patescibacteria group bacterium]|nr:2'-5' RNA ligase family protein [Patescibacteria group bacterium]